VQGRLLTCHRRRRPSLARGARPRLIRWVEVGFWLLLCFVGWLHSKLSCFARQSLSVAPLLLGCCSLLLLYSVHTFC
jgi:hypothetical protein